jgi:TolB-like protein
MIIQRTTKCFLWGLLLLSLAACANQTTKDTNLIKSNHEAAARLLAQAQQHPLFGASLDAGTPLIAASFVNIDNVQSSSTLGRMAAEQVGSYFAQYGYGVIELKLRSNVFIQEKTGELMLSREIKDISFQHNAQAVIVGTYAVGTDTVFVTAKLVRVADGIVLASHDYALPLGPDTKTLSRSDGRQR